MRNILDLIFRQAFRSAKWLVLFALVVMLPSLVHAQHPPDNEWINCYGGTDAENFTKLVHTSDGGYVIVGSANSTDYDVSGNHGNGDGWVVKVDFVGDRQWAKCLGGRNIDQLNSIAQTTDNGFIIAGNTNSDDGDVSGLHKGTKPYRKKSKCKNC